MLKLAVGTPAYRGVIASAQAKMWIQFGGHAARLKDQSKLDLVMIGDVDVCGVERARNILVEYAIQYSADWLIMVDSDTYCGGRALIDMIMDLDQECAMVGAIVRTRGRGDMNAYYWDDASKKHHAADYNNFAPGVRYQEVDAVGGAVIALNLQRLKPRMLFFPYYRDDGSAISEDLYFCKRLRERGEKILVDTKISTWHIDKPGVVRFDGL